MKRLMLFGTDKGLARFYYAAYLRFPTVSHSFRDGNVACYQCTNADHPDLIAMAEKLKVNHETVAPENKYRRLKTLIQESYQPGQPFKTDEIVYATGYKRTTVAQYLTKLTGLGYIESHGRTNGHYYCLPEPQEKPTDA